MGAEVHIVEGRRCCGLPQLNSGDRQTAIAMAKAAIESLERVSADRIVIPSSSCAITIAQDYARILSDDPGPTGSGAQGVGAPGRAADPWSERARKLADRVTAFTPFAASVLREHPLR